MRDASLLLSLNDDSDVESDDHSDNNNVPYPDSNDDHIRYSHTSNLQNDNATIHWEPLDSDINMTAELDEIFGTSDEEVCTHSSECNGYIVNKNIVDTDMFLYICNKYFFIFLGRK